MADTKKPYGNVAYADPKNGKYPIDTAAHAKAAWSYINMPKNAAQYPLNGVTLSEVKARIKAACAKFGVQLSEANSAGWAEEWLERFNKLHAPAGSAAGGQFAPASSSSSGKGTAGKKPPPKDARPTPTNARPVGMGETGKRVSDLQSRLNAFGFKLKTDGIFGPKTRAAVVAFQRAHGLKPDGLVGPLTTAALRTKTPAKAAAHTPAKPSAKPSAKAPAKTTPVKTVPVKTVPVKQKPRGAEPEGDDRASDLKYGKGSALWAYWTHGKGYAKWSGAVHKWTTLRDLLLSEGVPPGEADGLATNIIMAVMPGYMKQAHSKGKGRSAMQVPDLDGEDRAAADECMRSVPFELTDSSGDGDGLTLEGYAAVFNRTARITDRQGEFDEQIAPGAFAESLARQTPVLMFEHGKHPLIGSMPLGRIDNIREDKQGLFISARLSDNWLIQPVRDAVKDRAVTGMSFRFYPPSDGDQRWEKRDGQPDLRTLLRLDPPELGPVVFPAYKPTTASIRSLLDGLEPPEDFTGRDGARSAPGGEEQQDDVQPGNGGPSPATIRAALRDRTWRMRRTLND